MLSPPRLSNAQGDFMSESSASIGEADEESGSKGFGWVKIVLILAAVVGLVLLGRQAGGYVSDFAQWVEGLGVWGPIVFILGYAVATVAFLPGSILTLAAGAIFGLWKGVGFVFVGSSLGAALAFLVSRYLARGAIESKLEGNKKFAAIDKAVGAQGRKIVFLLRLSPIFPFNLLNYGLGLTKVRFVDYLIASAAGDLAALAAGGAESEKGPEQWVFLGIGLLATIVVTTVVTRTASKALKEATDG
nr:TVP38/TMEM64 family membrane protein slr0305-like [Nerophis lumbriciformis]